MQLIDHYSNDWEERTVSIIRKWLSHESSPHIYLLLDAAFRHETAIQLVRKLLPDAGWRSLYQDAPNTSERILAASPLLLTLNEDNLHILEAVAKETTGKPMLSMIVSRESMEHLWLRLSGFRIVTVQNTRYVLRLSDTRRLPEIFTMLTNEHRASLTGGILEWRYIGRDGLWHKMDIAPISAASTPRLSRPLEFKNSQLATLLEMNRIDAFLDGLHVNEPGLAQAFEKPSARYKWVKNTLDKTALAVDTYSKQLECCRQAAQKSGLYDEP